MPRHLHLVGLDAPPLMASVIAAEAREPDTLVTVALLDGAAVSGLPPHVAVVSVERDGAGYAALLELIFASDQVTAW